MPEEFVLDAWKSFRSRVDTSEKNDGVIEKNTVLGLST